MVIWKYQVNIEGEVSIYLPTDHKILSIQEQDGYMTAWAMVDPKSPKIEKTLYVYGTGHPVNPTGKTFISTVQVNGLVWHVFE
jgi:hypothetical protein